MKKQYAWKAKIKSPYGVETLLICKDKTKLQEELQKEMYKDFTIGNVEKSHRQYVTDGNTEIRYLPLHW
jgi:hypothetical protein